MGNLTTVLVRGDGRLLQDGSGGASETWLDWMCFQGRVRIMYYMWGRRERDGPKMILRSF